QRGRAGVDDLPAGIDHQEPGRRRSPAGSVGGDHDTPPVTALRGSAAAMAPANSRAASSGRLSASRSASGTAAACNGVSMSPGSIAGDRPPAAANAAAPGAPGGPSAALLAPGGPPPG